MSEIKEKPQVNRDYYKVLILSQTGKGKTYSSRNLDPNTTGFINAENKPLPFKNSFKYHARPKRFQGAIKALQDYSANPEIEVIFIDSMSSIMELLLEEMRQNFKGFDIWNNYNIKIREFINLIKECPKEVFVTGHYEVLDIEGEPEKRMKVKGKEWEGVVEKEFVMVLYADNKLKDDKMEYFFRTMGEGISAKVPPEIFGEGIMKVPNDCNEVLKNIYKFLEHSK